MIKWNFYSVPDSAQEVLVGVVGAQMPVIGRWNSGTIQWFVYSEDLIKLDPEDVYCWAEIPDLPKKKRKKEKK
jgi:hypothetical protein